MRGGEEFECVSHNLRAPNQCDHVWDIPFWHINCTSDSRVTLVDSHIRLALAHSTILRAGQRRSVTLNIFLPRSIGPGGSAARTTTPRPRARASALTSPAPVWVFGAAGPDYGDYEVRLDQVVLQRSAHQDSNATLPYVLYSAQNLTYDHHELTLSSRGNGGLLLDFIQTTVQLAPKGATVENQTLEETDGRIRYEGEWGNNQSGNFSGGGSTYTNGDGAYFELNFTASAIYVLGDKKNDHGLYEVTLSSNSSGSSSQLLSGVSGCGGAFGESCEQQLPSLKYFASNLANETYTLRLANIAGENNSYFDLDSIILSVPSEYDPRNLSSHDPIPTSSGASPSQTVGSGDSSSDNNSALALHNPLAVLVLSMLWLVRRWL